MKKPTLFTLATCTLISIAVVASHARNVRELSPSDFHQYMGNNEVNCPGDASKLNLKAAETLDLAGQNFHFAKYMSEKEDGWLAKIEIARTQISNSSKLFESYGCKVVFHSNARGEKALKPILDRADADLIKFDRELKESEAK
jgi:hypothetical protein